MSTIPIAHVPVAAGPAYAEVVRRLASRFTATLAAEPDNRFNHAAVAVLVSGEKIGYLPPELSRRYFGALKGTRGVQVPARRAPHSSRENTGTDVLLDLSGVPSEP